MALKKSAEALGGSRGNDVRVVDVHTVGNLQRANTKSWA